MRNLHRSATSKLALAALVAAILAGTAAATSYVKPADDDLIISSRAIITAKVISTGAQYDANSNHVFTYIRLKVRQVLKGSLASDDIVLKELGGEADGHGTFLGSAPPFAIGERVLLYMDTWPGDGSLRIHDQFLGKFSIARDASSGKMMVIRSAPQETPIRSQLGDVLSTDQMELSAYLKMLRGRISADMIQSQQFEAQYYGDAPFTATPPSYNPNAQRTTGALSPEFHLYSPPGRWFEVDAGHPVVCNVNPTNSPDPTGAVSDVEAAMAAWSNVSGCALQVMDGATTSSCQLIAGADNVDFNNCEGIFSPGVCADTLGEGGFDYTTSSPGIINGTSFYQITDGFASINPYAAACFFTGQVTNLREVLTHEMGHSLGMGHSWEPDFGGSPTPAEADATMYYQAHFDGRGASIRSDDMAGISFIYPGSAQTTPNYVGFVDGSSCTSIAGWAADKTRLNTSINVEVYDGTTLLTTVLANLSRPDVGASLGDNGLHGFNIPTPASLLDGGTHSIHVKFETSAIDLTNSPFSLDCALAPNYIGYVDTANCTSLIGWAADKNRLNVSINVEIYDGTFLLTTVLANVSRPDVGGFIGDDGLHGFNIPTPASLLDGNPHTVHIKFETSAVDLTNSPFSLNCGGGVANNYIGYVDTANCTSLIGWAADKNRLNVSINVEIYDGTSLLSIVLANVSRPDVGGFIGDDGLHGFNIPTPTSLLDGKTHTVHIKFETSTIDLTNSPFSIDCGGAVVPNYIGYVDTANCTSLIGWAADKNRLNVSINVEIYDGTTLLMTVLANVSRPDVGGFIGDNGLHGFNIPTPAPLQDGNNHTVHLKFETSAVDLANSPFTIACGIAPNYIGYVDTANCTSLIGWAADKNRLNVSINVEIYDGTTLLMTVLANLPRPDVGGFIGDNGLHGFNIPTPPLQNNDHTIHIKFETSTVDLSNSPFSLDCGTSSPNYIGYLDLEDQRNRRPNLPASAIWAVRRQEW